MSMIEITGLLKLLGLHIIFWKYYIAELRIYFVFPSLSNKAYSFEYLLKYIK